MAAYGGIGISIRGLDDVQAMLARLDDPNVKKVLQKASDAGGKTLEPFVRREVPYSAMKRAVWVHRAKRQRPATVVGHHKRIAFYWHMVIGGTRRHGPRSAPWLAFWSHGRYYVLPEVAGVKPNPAISRAYASGQGQAMAAVEKVVADYLEQIAGA